MPAKIASINARKALEILGANIKTARIKRRFSIKDFAERIGMSESTVIRLEKGHEGVSIRDDGRFDWIAGTRDGVPGVSAPNAFACWVSECEAVRRLPEHFKALGLKKPAIVKGKV